MELPLCFTQRRIVRKPSSVVQSTWLTAQAVTAVSLPLDPLGQSSPGLPQGVFSLPKLVSPPRQLCLRLLPADPDSPWLGILPWARVGPISMDAGSSPTANPSSTAARTVSCPIAFQGYLPMLRFAQRQQDNAGFIFISLFFAFNTTLAATGMSNSWGLFVVWTALLLAALLGCSCLIQSESAHIYNLWSSPPPPACKGPFLSSCQCDHATLPAAVFRLLCTVLHIYSVLQLSFLRCIKNY